MCPTEKTLKRKTFFFILRSTAKREKRIKERKNSWHVASLNFQFQTKDNQKKKTTNEFFISSFTGYKINYVTHLIGIHHISKIVVPVIYRLCIGKMWNYYYYYYFVGYWEKGEYCHGIYVKFMKKRLWEKKLKISTVKYQAWLAS